VTVLDVYGHLFYAGARTLARFLPNPGDAENPVVILRLRGRTTVGATLIDELSAYADQLAEAKGRLYLTGLSEDVYDQMERTGKLREADPVHAYKATPVVGESTHRAYVDAQTWLVSPSDEEV
jgi:sulfate permease, SulP family